MWELFKRHPWWTMFLGMPMFGQGMILMRPFAEKGSLASLLPAQVWRFLDIATSADLVVLLLIVMGMSTELMHLQVKYRMRTGDQP
jgi:hypothetical protein